MKIAISPHHNQLIYSPTIARPLLPTHHPMSQPNTNTFSIPYALLNDGINANTGKLTSNITMQPFHPKLVKAFFGKEETGEISTGINHESFQIVDKMLSESHEKSSLMDQDESISIDHQSGNVYLHGKSTETGSIGKGNPTSHSPRGTGSPPITRP